MRSERRYLSVMMCDLADSTQLSDTLDPDVFAEIIDTMITICADEIERHNGFVSAYQGDSVIALFGYPSAVENHAAHAVRAALAIIEKIKEYSNSLENPVAMRVGVASGTTLVSDVKRRGSTVQLAAYGYVPNLSGRLQATASLNTVLVDNRTHRLTKQFYDYLDLGQAEFKGFEKPKRLWQPTSELANDAAPKWNNTDNGLLISRSAEQQILHSFLNSKEIDGDSNTLVISGEPGIGKSRLMGDSIEYCSDQLHPLIIQCDELYSTTPFHPFMWILKSITGIDQHEDIASKRNLLLEAVDKFPRLDKNILSPLERIFGLRASDEAHEYEQLNQDLETFLFHTLFGTKSNNYTILFIDDLQWLDSASEKLISRFQTELPGLKIVATSRNLHRSSFFQQSRTIHLQPLDSEDSLSLINAISQTDFSKKEKQEILYKSDGNPLYIEELISAGKLRQSESNNRFSDQQLIPDTLQYSLLRRLDALGEAKNVATIAALIGREYKQDILKSVSQLGDDDIDSALEQLLDHNILSQNKLNDYSQLQFRHALIQEAAASLIPKLEQVKLHSSIADAIVERTDSTTHSNSAIVAHHLFEAERYDDALNQFKTAADITSETKAKIEAAEQYEKALLCLQKVNSTDQTLELNLQKSLGDVIYAAVGHATDAGLAAFERATTLARNLGDSTTEAQILDGLFGIHFNSANFSEAEQACEKLNSLAVTANRKADIALATQGLGMCSFHRGDFLTAKNTLESATALLKDSSSITSDFPSMSFLYLSLANQLLGNYQEANINYDNACTYASDSSAYNHAAALGNGCHFYQIQGRNDKIKENLNILVPLAEQHGFGMWLSLAQFFSGWITATETAQDVGLENMKHVFSELEDDIEKTYYLGLIAKVEIQTGELALATQSIDSALSLANEKDENYYTSELLRLKAAIERGQGDYEGSEKSIIHAKKIAVEQSASHWLKLINNDQATLA